jgi:hypothetical protein
VSLCYSNQLANKRVHAPLASSKILTKDLDRVAQLVAELQAALQPFQNTPTASILSASHSGSLMPQLKRDSRIITSAAKDKSSFGCQLEVDNTYFINDLPVNVDKLVSIKSRFNSANQQVKKWEQEEPYPASKPQIFIGKDSLKWANQTIEKWLRR